MRKRNHQTIRQVVAAKRPFLRGLSLLFALWMIFSPVFPVTAETLSVTQLEEEIKEGTASKDEVKMYDEYEALERKAKAYEQIIKLKQKQQQTLNNQLSLLDTEIKKIESEIDINRQKIEDLNSHINIKLDKIGETEDNIDAQKKLLSGLLQMYYAQNQEKALVQMMEKKSWANFFNGKDRLEQISNKMNEMLHRIKSAKDKLETERDELIKNKKEVIELHQELEEKTSSLEKNKSRQVSLLNDTRGEEAKYQEALQRIEQQKMQLLGDIDQLYIQNFVEINALLKDLPKPTSGLASTGWFYSQKDSRWGSARIGNSNSLMKDYGCAVAAVAMAFTYLGEKINPGQLAREPIFYWDLIAWPSQWNNKLELVENTRHQGVDWKRIDREIEDGNGVIVFVKVKGNQGHYVVIHNKDKNGYIVHDPYFGPNIYLDSTKKLMAAMYKVSPISTVVDQMIIYKKK